MEVRFEVAGPDDDGDLQSLCHWLRDDRSLRGHAQIKAVRGESSRRMGSGVELVLAVVSTAAALAQLPISYMAWRQGRRPQASLTVNVLGVKGPEAEAMLRELGVRPSDTRLTEGDAVGPDCGDSMGDAAGGAR